MIDVDELVIDEREVLRYAGYRGDAAPDPEELPLQKLLEKCRRIIRPACCKASFSYDEAEQTIKTAGYNSDGRLVLPGESIKEFLSGADECVIFAATLGMEIDMEIRRLEIREPFEALMLDAAATAATEALAEYCQRKIEEELREKRKCINGRFSPGFGDMPLSFQKDVSLLLGMQKNLGISLSPSFLMTPMKSITAIVGVFNNKQEIK